MRYLLLPFCVANAVTSQLRLDRRLLTCRSALAPLISEKDHIDGDVVSIPPGVRCRDGQESIDAVFVCSSQRVADQVRGYVLVLEREGWLRWTLGIATARCCWRVR